MQPAPVEKLRWDLIPQAETEADAQGQSGLWLVDRLRELETERQTTWSNLLSRITPGKPPEADDVCDLAQTAQDCARAIGTP